MVTQEVTNESKNDSDLGTKNQYDGKLQGPKLAGLPMTDFNIMKNRALCQVLRRLCDSTSKKKRVVKVLHKVLLVLESLLVLISRQLKATSQDMLAVIERALNQIETILYDTCTASLPVYFMDPDGRNQSIDDWMQYIETSAKTFMKESSRKKDLLFRLEELRSELAICQKEEHIEYKKLNNNVFAMNFNVAKMVCDDIRYELKAKLAKTGKEKKLLSRTELTDEDKRQLESLDSIENRYKEFLEVFLFNDFNDLGERNGAKEQGKQALSDMKREKNTEDFGVVDEDETDESPAFERKKRKFNEATEENLEIDNLNENKSDELSPDTEFLNDVEVSNPIQEQDVAKDTSKHGKENDFTQKPTTKLPIDFYNRLFKYIESDDDMKMYLACMSFRVIASFTPKEADYMVLIGALEAVMKVLESTKLFRLQEQAVAALCSMTVDSKNRKKLVELGKHKILTQTVETFLDSKEMEESLRGFIWDVKMFEENCSSYIDEENQVTIPAIMPLAEACPNDSLLGDKKTFFSDHVFKSLDFLDEPGSYLASMGFRFISHFSFEERNHIASNDGIALMAKLIENFNESARIQEQAMAALCNMAIDKSNRIKLVNENIPRLVAGAMEQNKDCTALQLVGCGILKNISNDLNDAMVIADCFENSDIILAMIEAIENDLNCEILVKFACDTLLNMARYRDSDRLLIIKSGGKTLLQRIKSDGKISKELEFKICSTLKTLDRKAPKGTYLQSQREKKSKPTRKKASNKEDSNKKVGQNKSNPKAKKSPKNTSIGDENIISEDNHVIDSRPVTGVDKKESEDSKTHLDIDSGTETITAVHSK